MSLNSLPDEILAKIAKKMPHADRIKLMATSHRHAKIGQNYRLQYKYGKVDHVGIRVLRRKSNTIWLVTIEKEMRPLETVKIETTFEGLRLIFNEISFIGELALHFLQITGKVIKELVKYKSKISSLRLCYADVILSKSDFLLMVESFSEISFHDITMLPPKGLSFSDYGIEDVFMEKDLLSEEVLAKFLPEISALQLYSPNINNGNRLTDRLLQEIIPKCWPKWINLRNCQTSFTFDGVLTFIKLAASRNPLLLCYNFGVFIVENIEDAVAKIKTLANEIKYELEIRKTQIGPSIDDSFERTFIEMKRPGEICDEYELIMQFTMSYIA